MYNNFKIVQIDSKYCDYLRVYDNKVYFNAGKKSLRPFVGVLFYIQDLEYFAPLSSPKSKHKLLKNKIDLIKIKDGEYGVINLNNMIPVKENNYKLFDLDNEIVSKEDKLRNNLLKKQLRYLNSNKVDVLDKARLLYILYDLDCLPKRVKDRCCNFKLLEEKCNIYNKLMEEVNI